MREHESADRLQVCTHLLRGALLCSLSLGVSACSDDDVRLAEDAESLIAAGDWPMYGHDLANTQSAADTGPLTASLASLAPATRFRVGGGATSTPLVVDGVIYFGAWDGFFYAMQRDNGELLWKVQLGSQYIRSTPWVGDERIYVAADTKLFGLARSDGEVLFETTLSEHPQAFIESSPKVADGVVVIGVAGFELNLVKDDYTFEGSVVGLDAEGGGILWRVPVTGVADGPCMGGSGVSVWSSAAIDRKLGLAYIGTGQTYEAPASTCNDSLLAIHYKANHKGERLAWKATYTKDDVYVATEGGLNGLDHDIGAAPNLFLAGAVEAVGAGDKGGTYRAFDRATGEPLWRADLMTSGFAQLGGVMTTAAVADGTVFVSSNSWNLFGFITTGEHAEEDTATMYALNTEDGEVLWSEPLDAPVFGTFAVAGDVLFHPTIRGDVYARDVATGEQLWKASVGAPIGSGVSVTADGLYVSAGFSLGTDGGQSHVTMFQPGAETLKEVDLRVDTFKELTAAECDAALEPYHSDAACRTCLCACNASTTGACQGACWEQASCVISSCAEADFSGAEGPACYQDHCTSKLLPPNVLQESLRSAACVIACADSCMF